MRSLAGLARIPRVIPLLGLLALGSCQNELETSSNLTVTLQEATPWPDTLGTGEIATVLANVVGPDGGDIAGVDLQWSSSDSSVVQVTRPDTGTAPSQDQLLSIGRRAILTTHATGTATIVARLDRPGFVPTELRVPVVVKQGGWPALLTVGEQDTIGIGLAHADLGVLGTLSYAWQSSDPAVLQATAVANDPSRAQLTARSGGAAQVTLEWPRLPSGRGSLVDRPRAAPSRAARVSYSVIAGPCRHDWRVLVPARMIGEGCSLHA